MSAIAPYCEAQDILGTLPRLLGNVSSPNSQISLSKISQLCNTVSAEMDSRFSIAGFSVPINFTNNQRVEANLRRIAIDGVCARVLHTIYNTGEVNFQLGDSYRSQYYRDIQNIEDNGFGEGIERIRTTGGAPVVGPNYAPVFKKGVRIV